MKPPPKETVSQWADAKRKLSPESSAAPGQWRTSMVEYTRGIMDAFSDARVKEVVGVFASQAAKTECVNNMIGQRIESNPGPMLLIQPTLKMAEAWSKDRLAPMIRDTPCLRGRIADAKSRNTGNTVLHKQFPGGHLTIAGANSAASLAMRPIRDVFFDEEDRYPSSAGTEGDPVKLATTRTKAFWNAKHVHISSPGIKGVSRIEKVWAQSDQRYFHVPCHVRSCGAMQTLKWSQVHWDKDLESGDAIPSTARYVCEACGATWNDLQRRAAVRRGEWRATKPFRGIAGFHVSALYSPWESSNLESLVTQWVEAQGNPSLLKVFINTVLAEWWEEELISKKLDGDELFRRREALPDVDGRVRIPSGVAVLTAGVDIQDTRFEISVWGWGRDEESWLLAHHVLWGDPTTKQGDVLSAAWAALDAWLLTPFPRELGGVDYIRAVSIDTGGHHTQAAYDYAAPRFRRITPDGGQQFVFAIVGRAGPGELWPQHQSKKVTRVPLWPLRVDAAKGAWYSRLGLVDPGPGYAHFPMVVDAEYFKGLCAEKCVPYTDQNGFVKLVWKKKSNGLRNEPLDCAVYALAALHGLRVQGYNLNLAVDEIADRRRDEEIQRSVEAVDSPPPPTPRGPPPRSDSWLGNTRDWLR